MEQPEPGEQAPADVGAEVQPEPLHSDREVYRRSLIVLAFGLLISGSLLGLRGRAGADPAAPPSEPSATALVAPRASAPPTPAVPETPRLDERVERCGPVAPTATDHFGAPRELSLGRAWIPRRGGHDPSFGYDVLIHFHAHKAARKIVQPFSDRLVFVGVDLGDMTGDYSKPLSEAEVFTDLRASITSALRHQSGHETAHIKSLSVSGWSAGVGAVPTLLKRFSAEIDALILLDGLHAGWKLDKPTDGTQASVEVSYLTPVIRFAKLALAGDKQLIISHSDVPTEGYAPTRVTADRLLSELKLERTLQDPGQDTFGRWGSVDQGGFALWAHHGSAERGHCAELVLLADALEARVLPWLARRAAVRAKQPAP